MTAPFDIPQRRPGDEFDEQAALAAINGHPGELVSKMGIAVVSVTPEQMIATMPVEGNRQPYGLLHGGASGVLAETLGSMHAAVLAPAGTYPVGIELNCTHHRSATSGTVAGTSTVLSAGRTLAAFDISVRDEQGRRVCTARLSCIFRPQNPQG